jgi:hypothetical protein
MKQILIVLFALFVCINGAEAQNTRGQVKTRLTQLGMSAELASQVSNYLTGRAYFSEDAKFSTSGTTVSIQEATAASACSGSVTANATTPVVVSTTCATSTGRLFLTKTSTSAVNGSCYQSAVSNGVSFTITCLATDTGTYNWFFIHESP